MSGLPSETAPAPGDPLAPDVVTELAGGTLRITVTGPVTGAVVARLRTSLQAAATGGRLPLVLDLRGAGEVGTDGLTLLSVVARAVAGTGQPMTVLVADGSQPQRVLRLGGLGALVTVLSPPQSPRAGQGNLGEPG